MPQLNEQQLKKRGEILQGMFNSYLSTHAYKTYDDACWSFMNELDNDPDKISIINALAASCT